MDLRKVKKLIELLHETGVAELEVRSGDETIRVVAAVRAAAAENPPPATPGATDDAPPREPAPATGSTMRALMAGTFYRAPAPGEQPFVDVGDTVAVGDVLCIIESMKMMNQVESEYAGEIAEVLADNGKPIESGASLFRIR